jgi:hypothetical protein
MSAADFLLSISKFSLKGVNMNYKRKYEIYSITYMECWETFESLCSMRIGLFPRRYV